jgi:hypothetical protein
MGVLIACDSAVVSLLSVRPPLTDGVSELLKTIMLRSISCQERTKALTRTIDNKGSFNPQPHSWCGSTLLLMATVSLIWLGRVLSA